MGNTDSLPDRITEEQAKEVAGELWNQYIFDSIVDDDGLAAKQDVIDSASEALMAFQGESVEIMRVTQRKKKTVVKKFQSNQEFGKHVYQELMARNNGPSLEICQMAHLGQLDDICAMCELSDGSGLDDCDTRIDKNALMISSFYNFQNIVEYLAERGCNLDKQNNEGKTALHYAAQIGNWDVCTFLVKKGASTDVKDSLGRLAGDWCESDYSGSGFVKQDETRILEIKTLLAPKNPKNKLYDGPRVGKEQDPPSAEVVGVEIADANAYKKKESIAMRTGNPVAAQVAANAAVITAQE